MMYTAPAPRLVDKTYRLYDGGQSFTLGEIVTIEHTNAENKVWLCTAKGQRCTVPALVVHNKDGSYMVTFTPPNRGRLEILVVILDGITIKTDAVPQKTDPDNLLQRIHNVAEIVQSINQKHAEEN